MFYLQKKRSSQLPSCRVTMTATVRTVRIGGGRHGEQVAFLAVWRRWPRVTQAAGEQCDQVASGGIDR